MSGSNSSNLGGNDGARGLDPSRGDVPPLRGLQLTVHPLPQVDLESTSDREAGRGDAGHEARRRSGRIKMLLVLLISAAPVIASYFVYFVVQPRGEASHAELIVPTRSWPATVALAEADGTKADLALWRQQWSLVVFGRGACDGECERRLYTQRQLREMLGRDRDRVDKVFVVLDDAPLRPELAVALAAQPPVHVLRASAGGVAAWLRVPPAELEQRMFVVDPMGEWMMRTPPHLDPSKFKRDLERLLRASSSWDRAGR
jgi:hypothetical protein